VAWGGTALLISPASRILGDPSSTLAAVLGNLALWALCAIVLAIVVRWDREPLSSIWLNPPRWSSVAWGLALTAVMLLVLSPFSDWVRRATGLPGFQQGMEAIAPLPFWLRLFGAVTAGIVEEILFHGYAITRLARLTGHLWIAAIAATVVFAVLHYPVWGAGPVVGWLAGGLLTTLFLLWRRDLVTMMIAHVAVDAWGIAILPIFGEWWHEG
jgi:membrane protease YdiL (CAAX protease family)